MPNNKIIDLDRLSRFKSDYDASLKTLNGVALYGSGNYTFDDEFSEVSTNAVENKVVSLAVKEINYELAIIRESLFEVLLTEIDYKVSYAMNYAIPDTLSDSDGTHRVVYSETQLKSVEGNGIVINQIVQNGDFATESVWYSFNTNYATISYSNGKLKIICVQSGGNASTTRIQQVLPQVIPNTHKVLVKVKGKGTYDSGTEKQCYAYFGGTSQNINLGEIKNTDTTLYAITTMTADRGNFSIGAYIGESVGNYIEYEYVEVIDLTQMFGAGNEPTTTDDNRIQWLLSLGYIPYNTGSLANTTISGVKINGYNLFNENWKIGNVNPESLTTDACACVDYISVVPNKTYLLEVSDFGYTPTIYVLEYDENYNLLLQTSYFGNSKTTIVSANTKYIKFYLYRASYNFTNNFPQVCLHITGTRTGYAPYVTPTIISIPQTTLLGAISSHDTISVVEGNIVEGEQLYDMVLTRNIGTIDLGTITSNYWVKGSESRWLIYTSAIPNILKHTGADTKANIIADKWATTNSSSVSSSTGYGTIYVANNGDNLFIKDSAYDSYTASTIASAMSGIYLQYELATPTQTTIATDLEFDQVSSLIEQGGSIEPLFTNVPPNVETTFVVKKAVGE